MSKRFLSWIGSLGLLLLPAAATMADDAQDQAKALSGSVRVTVNGRQVEVPIHGVQVHVEAQAGQEHPINVWNVQAGTASPRATAITIVSGHGVTLGDYWLGLVCRPVDDALRAQLGLPEGQGVLVEKVVPDSPAAKAKIQPHDVLVSAGDKTLTDVAQLQKAVEAAKEKELALELIRGGKKITVKATPAKRPDEVRPGPHPDDFFAPADDARRAYQKAMQRWRNVLPELEQFQQGEGHFGPLQFRFFHPGTILPPDAAWRPPLPKNLRVTITREGDEPANVVVKKDDQQWEITENELDKLPRDVRPHVERMLGRIPAGPLRLLKRREVVPPRPRQPFQLSEPSEPSQPPRPRIQIEERLKVAPPRDRLEKQLDEMNRQMEQLRQSIEELRKKDRP